MIVEGTHIYLLRVIFSVFSSIVYILYNSIVTNSCCCFLYLSKYADVYP